MDIKNVTLHAPSQKEAGGLVIPPVFLMELENGETVSVPHDPRNSDYMRIANWYDEQKKKPFKFTFESTPDLTEDNAASDPAPQQELTEPTPDISTKINLTKEQRREITKVESDRQARIARRNGTDGSES